MEYRHLGTSGLRVSEPEVVPLCAAEGIGQVVFSPIAQGVLTGGAAGKKLDAGLMRAIDAVLGDAVTRDPSRTASPPQRPLG
jgi:aryl-alcohol dehydrogenase-like predicted oxidoreductase